MARVEGIGGTAAGDDGGAGPERNANVTGYELLRGGEEGVVGGAKGVEPEPVVDELRPARLELALRDQLFLRQHELLQRPMCLDQRDRRGRLVQLPALDPDGAVLDHVDAADT